MLIKYDKQAGAWTDGTRFVKGSLIREYSQKTMGKKEGRGRLSRSEVAKYWLDTYGVSADVR